MPTATPEQQAVWNDVFHPHYQYPDTLGQPPIDKSILFQVKSGRHVVRNQIVPETGTGLDRTIASVGLYLSETSFQKGTSFIFFEIRSIGVALNAP